ncbi:hypothetical protein F9C07_2212558 [Aspergillus flavus]|uniref:Uncharacterized protein n=1 Tax=Aspergillus flavus (strain ATCC 200026 / FGSC A1120 / IAM 13836 / NRRL 3357 / JCM 12722 / SRRC 167) TaxID=332952 RepID=A0A7U2QYN7_ASPFN|nr:hypothetical protein F9C07_2212558 [Aspergillus flavus]
MNVLAPPSSHEQPGNLRLTRRKIVELGIIAKSDWIKVHPENHPVPFVGIESGKKGRLHTLDDAYKFFGMEQEPPHSGHPTEPESPSVLSDVLFEIQDTQSYTKDVLNYSYKTRALVEIICRELLKASDNIEYVIPGGQLTTSLPTAEITKRQYYGLLTTNLSNFHASPVLHITDVDMLLLCDPESPKWRPRRFSTTWTLYDTILHATYRRTAPVTPVVGVHSDLSVLVNQIRLRGSRVTFMSTPLRKQPFEYLRREDFRLKHTISESDIPSDLIRQVLLLEHTRQSQDDDTAEEYLADNGERLVDSKPRCEFYTCPLPKVANSRYCGIHSAEILQIASSRSTERRMDDKENSQLEWNLTSRSHCERVLKLLKEYLLESPQANWVIDFEFLSIRAKSPIPLQVSIRQMDGETLLSTNVDYGISISEIIEAVTPYTGANIGPFLVRLYKSYRTNGMKPSQIRGHILKLGYSPGKVNIFSCAMSEAFASRVVCMTLEATHIRLLENQSRYVDIDLYHTAEYDTQAVADIVKAMTEIV